MKQTIEKEDYKVYDNEEITNSMLEKIVLLDKEFFDEKYLWDKDYQTQIFYKNKNSMIVVMNKDKLIGYLNYLVITEKKYEEMINSNVIIDEFKLDEICEFSKERKNYLTLNSVVIDKNFQNGYAVRLLTHSLNEILKQMNNNGYKIGAFNGFAVSLDGRKFLENLGFKKVKELEDKNCLYILEGSNLKEYLEK